MLTPEQQIFDQIEKAKQILITFNKNWSGDGVASALALRLFLKKMGKEADIVADRMNGSTILSFLPGYGEIKFELDNLRKFIVSIDISNAKVGQIKYKIEENTLNFIIAPKEGFFTAEDVRTRSGDFKYDLIIVLDTPDLESLGKVYDGDTEFFYQAPVINVDHHSNNENFGQMNQVELTAIATSEIVFNLFSGYPRIPVDADIATCLMAGIISKTKSFKTQNITPQALTISSQLITLGARREEIVNRLYRSRSLAVLKLWGRVLARLQSDLDNRLIWSVLTDLDFEKTGTGEGDLFEVIDELMVNIPQADLIVLAYEVLDPTSGLKISKALVYSTRNIDALSLTKTMESTGTKKLAQLTMDKPVQEAEIDLINLLKTGLSHLSV